MKHTTIPAPLSDDDVLLDDRQSAALFDVGPTMFRELERAPGFPPAIRISGSRHKRRKLSELRAFRDAQREPQPR